MLKSLSPLWRLAKCIYHEWALRQIDPLHPDVPHIVTILAELRK